MKEKVEHPNFWIFEGLLWGLFMFLMMTLVFPWFYNEAISLKEIILGIVFYGLLGGLLYGYTMKLFRKKFSKRKTR